MLISFDAFDAQMALPRLKKWPLALVLLSFSALGFWRYLSTRPPNYQRLEALLSERQWEAADQETEKLILEIGWYRDRTFFGGSYDGLIEFPCQDLATIDNLWRTHSQGKFGLSVQQQFWASLDPEDFENEFDLYDALLDKFGWSQTITYSLEAPTGHLPSQSWMYESSPGKGEAWIESGLVLYQRMAECGLGDT
ncbi:MAG: GUN4 domain-containing protein [Cyanobacteria bacterium J06635_1]